MVREDTIAAIATPMGEGGIGIVRLSGKDAISIATHIFLPKRKKDLSKVRTFTTHYGHIYEDGRVVEEVILTVMRAPYTYTREDVVEISCHGGIVPLRKVLELCLRKGARLAEPGEFTLRAFLNGRIDLAQAEAVCDIIRAQTETALNCALQQLEGRLSNRVRKIRADVLNLLAHIEAYLDNPEEDIPELTREEIGREIARITREINELLDSSHAGRIIKEGLKIAIVGKPNVGKSSLLNTLLEEDKAIVSKIPGTTRDVVEDMFEIRGIPIKVMDTAGIREAKDELEEAGIARARKAIALSDLVLFVIDLSIPLSKEDHLIGEDIEGKHVIILGNKCDLPQVVREEEIRKLWATCRGRAKETENNYPLPKQTVGRLTVEGPPFLKISATEKIGIGDLRELIYGLFVEGEIAISDAFLVTSVRHQDALLRAKEALRRGSESLGAQASEDFIAMDLQDCASALGEILGETVTDDILERIFSNFCIGK